MYLHDSVDSAIIDSVAVQCIKKGVISKKGSSLSLTFTKLFLYIFKLFGKCLVIIFSIFNPIYYATHCAVIGNIKISADPGKGFSTVLTEEVYSGISCRIPIASYGLYISEPFVVSKHLQTASKMASGSGARKRSIRNGLDICP